MQVVVVMDEHLDDAGRAVEVGAGADEDDLRTGPREPVDQVLGEPVVDLVDPSRRPLAPVAARVVDIGVEPVLVRDVADAAELGPKSPPCGRDRSPIPTRGACGWAAANASITVRRVRTSRSVPYRRHGRSGERRSTGSHVKKWTPSRGNRTPPTRLPA